MKHSNFIYYILLPIFYLFFNITSCDNDNNNSNIDINLIYGTWIYVDGEYSIQQITFNNNGSYINTSMENFNGDWKTTEVETGNWIYNNNTLTLVNNGTETTILIVSLTSNQLIFKEDGENFTLIRQGTNI